MKNRKRTKIMILIGFLAVAVIAFVLVFLHQRSRYRVPMPDDAQYSITNGNCVQKTDSGVSYGRMAVEDPDTIERLQDFVRDLHYFRHDRNLVMGGGSDYNQIVIQFGSDTYYVQLLQTKWPDEPEATNYCYIVQSRDGTTVQKWLGKSSSDDAFQEMLEFIKSYQAPIIPWE